MWEELSDIESQGFNGGNTEVYANGVLSANLMLVFLGVLNNYSFRRIISTGIVLPAIALMLYRQYQ